MVNAMFDLLTQESRGVGVGVGVGLGVGVGGGEKDVDFIHRWQFKSS